MRFNTVLVSAAFVLLSGCAATSFKSTWVDPEVTEPVAMTGKKVIVVASNVPTAARHSIETSIAAELNKLGAQAAPSHNLLPAGTSNEEAKQKLAAEGYDAAFVVRMTNREQEINSTPGMYAPYGGAYGSYWGWGGGWGGAYAAPEIRTDIKVYIETLVYSVKRNKLVWSGLSVTTNPGNLEASAAELARIAVEEMKKTGKLI
jgi:hypothetical protein